MAGHLRVYRGTDEDSFSDLPSPEVSIRLGDLLPLIALAHHDNYLWLRDFLDDEVRVTADLYEILQTFRAYRPSA